MPLMLPRTSVENDDAAENRLTRSRQTQADKILYAGDAFATRKRVPGLRVKRRSGAAPKGERWVSTHRFQGARISAMPILNPWVDTHGSPGCAEENNKLHSSRATEVRNSRGSPSVAGEIVPANSGRPLILPKHNITDSTHRTGDHS
jgi:hypothetical protein